MFMKVVSYKRAAERILWMRELKVSALRNRILASVANRLSAMPPNTALNIKHPWKERERFSIRAWCPLHCGEWARLIVRAGEDGQLSFECFRGCSQDAIERAVNLQNVTVIGELADRISSIRSGGHTSGRVAPGNSRSSSHSSADGRRLFLVSTSNTTAKREQRSVTLQKISGSLSRDFQDDPAA
jgi:hypothetical protein